MRALLSSELQVAVVVTVSSPPHQLAVREKLLKYLHFLAQCNNGTHMLAVIILVCLKPEDQWSRKVEPDTCYIFQYLHIFGSDDF